MDFVSRHLKCENLKSTTLNVDEAVVSLGITTASRELRKNVIGITIAIPTDWPCKLIATKHLKYGKIKKETIHRKYGTLPPEIQYGYLINTYIPQAITPFVERGIVIPELTKKGNIHAHLICYSPDIQTTIDMITLQRTIYSSIIVRQMTGGKIERHKYLNFIHFLKDVSEWVDYMRKDEEQFINDKRFQTYTFTSEYDKADVNTMGETPQYDVLTPELFLSELLRFIKE